MDQTWKPTLILVLRGLSFFGQALTHEDFMDLNGYVDIDLGLGFFFKWVLGLMATTFVSVHRLV